MKSGTIGFEGCKISCIIGNNEEERLKAQDIFVDLKVAYDITAAALSDRFEDAICYVALSDSIKQIAIEKQYRLLEALAVKIVEMLMEKFNLKWIYVKIRKPSAIPFAECAFIECERGNRS